MDNKEWRLQGQDAYLKGAILIYKQYKNRNTATDHDHCEFCFAKFSGSIPDALKAGYTTTDDYRWICETCFKDFREQFLFILY